MVISLTPAVIVAEKFITQKIADLVTFTKEIFNGKLHFLCSVKDVWHASKYACVTGVFCVPLSLFCGTLVSIYFWCFQTVTMKHQLAIWHEIEIWPLYLQVCIMISSQASLEEIMRFSGKWLFKMMPSRPISRQVLFFLASITRVTFIM